MILRYTDSVNGDTLFFPVTNPRGDYHGFARPMGWAEEQALRDATNPFAKVKTDAEYMDEERRLRVDVLMRPSVFFDRIMTVSGNRPVRVPFQKLTNAR